VATSACLVTNLTDDLLTFGLPIIQKQDCSRPSMIGARLEAEPKSTPWQSQLGGSSTTYCLVYISAAERLAVFYEGTLSVLALPMDGR